MAKIRALFADRVKWAIVATEKHADGTPHLHCLISLLKEYSSTNPNTLDQLINPAKHGNYQAARNVTDVMKYVTKDGDYIAYGVNVKDFLKARVDKKSTKSTVISRMISEGANLDEVEQWDPGYFLMHMRKIMEYQQWKMGQSIRILNKPTKNLQTVVALEGSDPQTPRIARWLTKNLNAFRARRQKQLWIWGPGGIGKSTAVHVLSSYVKICEIFKIGQDFIGGYDAEAGLILIDEFKGQFSKQWMNRFLEGGDMMINEKGTTQWKRGNQPVVIVSNCSPQECYKIPDSSFVPSDFQALMSRVKVVECQTNIRLGAWVANRDLPETQASPIEPDVNHLTLDIDPIDLFAHEEMHSNDSVVQEELPLILENLGLDLIDF